MTPNLTTPSPPVRFMADMIHLNQFYSIRLVHMNIPPCIEQDSVFNFYIKMPGVTPKAV